MSDLSIGFFLPIRSGSQRVINKNTKPFADVEGGITELKLSQLLKCESLREIVLSTNDEQAMEVARRLDPQGTRIQVIPRPEALCLDSTAVSDLIKYVPSVMSTDHILWGHATAPFATDLVYTQAVERYRTALTESYDSLLTVSRLQSHILDPATAKVINSNSEEQWPRTQDLPLWYEVNHAFYIASKAVYAEHANRIGVRPLLYELGRVESFDIDWDEDFLIAEAIYEKLYANN